MVPSALVVGVTVNGLLASVVSVLTVTAATADFLTSASEMVRFTFLPFTSVEMYLPSPLIPNVSSLRFTDPVLVATSPVNFNVVAPVAAFNCSSVAARPFVAKSAPVTVVLDKPVISFVVPPVTVTLPVLTVPSAPLTTTAFVPPVLILLVTPSIPTVPICALPAVIVLVFVPSVIVLDVALDVFTLAPSV